MQRVFALWIAIRRGIVYSTRETKAPAPSEVVEEGRPIKELKFLNHQCRALFCLESGFWILFKLCN